MKRVYSFLFSLFVFTVSGQDQLEAPISWHFDETGLALPETIVLPTFDHNFLLEEDELVAQTIGRENYGRIALANYEPSSAGNWTVFPDGSKLWQLRFKTENALAVCVFMDDFHVPEGGKLWLWSADKSYFVGPYSHEDNNDHGRMSTDEVFGDEAVLEYFQPTNAEDNFSLTTYGFGHFYRDIYDVRDLWERGGGAAPCEVDVNCPEGLSMEGQRDAVVKLRIADGIQLFLCSGVMLNNTAMDGDQIMLTALHCTEGVSDSDLLLMQVKFNYERSGCASGGLITSHNRVGVVELGNSNDGGGNTGSDFAVYRVEDPIPPEWSVFFAGWDATGAGSTSGVGIHHPKGDKKKISTYGSALISDNWGFASNSHWRVVWQATVTNHGVTEGGSSGSPLYNTGGLVLGTLTGGSSCCQGFEDPQNGCVGENAPDYYGKLSYHWDANPNPTADLKDILDPGNTGQEVMFGSYGPDFSVEWVYVPELQFPEVAFYPNPAHHKVAFQMDVAHRLKSVDVYDAVGQCIMSISNSSNSGEILLDKLPVGMYYFNFITVSGIRVSHKLAKI